MFDPKLAHLCAWKEKKKGCMSSLTMQIIRNVGRGTNAYLCFFLGIV